MPLSLIQLRKLAGEEMGVHWTRVTQRDPNTLRQFVGRPTVAAPARPAPRGKPAVVTGGGAQAGVIAEQLIRANPGSPAVRAPAPPPIPAPAPARVPAVTVQPVALIPDKAGVSVDPDSLPPAERNQVLGVADPPQQIRSLEVKPADRVRWAEKGGPRTLEVKPSDRVRWAEQGGPRFLASAPERIWTRTGPPIQLPPQPSGADNPRGLPYEPARLAARSVSGRPAQPAFSPIERLPTVPPTYAARLAREMKRGRIPCQCKRIGN